MEFKNKKILLISPQPWGMMHLSKHHYAIELAKMGNEVYFLSPPSTKGTAFAIRTIEEHPGLFEVDQTLPFKSALRFKIRWLFDLLMRRHVRSLINWLGFNPDIVWCFDPNLYSDLRWFHAGLHIYHPVDPITRKDQVKPSFSADIIFSVSEKILSAFKDVPVLRYFINHGLSKPFEMEARKNLERLKDYKQGNPLKAGYVGNLMRPIIDREEIKIIIKVNPHMEFHFWGPWEMKQSNVAGADDMETMQFIDFLKVAPNVRLRGPKPPEILAMEIQDMDLFLFTYRLVDGESDRSNSHKILEYLSTGKPVFSCPIDTYTGSDLIIDIELIKRSVAIGDFNGIAKENYEIRMKRIVYCLENTYEMQLQRIVTLLRHYFPASSRP